MRQAPAADAGLDALRDHIVEIVDTATVAPRNSAQPLLRAQPRNTKHNGLKRHMTGAGGDWWRAGGSRRWKQHPFGRHQRKIICI